MNKPVRVRLPSGRSGKITLAVLAVVALGIITLAYWPTEQDSASNQRQSTIPPTKLNSTAKNPNASTWPPESDPTEATEHTPTQTTTQANPTSDSHDNTDTEMDERLASQNILLQEMIGQYDQDLTNQEARKALSAALLNSRAHREDLIVRLKQDRATEQTNANPHTGANNPGSPPQTTND
ncbi:MAG: hypothetical protein K0U66_09945 [Gammaproteobacteria bacterium]|nr:hypothetical protein [Pseudomonadota bacterium]MCH9663956.1 hypothetical protein [Gammaproteobacteria bacterium]